MRKLIVLLAVAGLLGGAWTWQHSRSQPAEPAPQQAAAPDPAPVEEQPKQKTANGYKVFTGKQFKALSDEAELAGTKPVVTPPAITGNAAADKRLRQLAEAQGYELRAVASAKLATADGKPLQPSAAKAWRKLQAAAREAGLELSVASGFRSVADQRAIFMGKLGATGFSLSQVAKGQADAAVKAILNFSSIPGYSKHHTGYAIDIVQDNGSLERFKSTAGFKWISKNNYHNAKRFGFIPSYPDGAGKQGPVPEPWEYLYVGRDVLVAE